ncbi:MAG: glycosyltransferase family A protein [Candidatus Shapirobacteria bacterium]
MSTIIKDLSVAIITYRRPKKLQACLQSIKIQSHQPKNIIVIDSLAQKTTIPESRNLALRRCHTKYIAFIDDDCLLDKNWTFNAYQAILTNPQSAYIVGRTKLLNFQNPVAKVQFDAYQNWFSLTHPLDTKNVIFNFQKIKNLRFDTQFKIFEDVDFNQQLLENNLSGIYSSKMIVHHPEVSNIFKALKKNYIRGQYKAKITFKWGNFDNYFPSIPHLKNPIIFLLNLAFSLGYLKKSPRPITIINKNDRGANQQRSQSFYNYLKKHHYFVTTIDSHAEFQKVIASRKYLFIFGWPLLKYRFLKSYYIHHRIDIYPKLITQTMLLKGMIISRLLIKNRSSLAIIQYPEDMLAVIHPNRPYQTLYDSPTIYSHELAQSQLFSQKTISDIQQFEKNVFKNSDFISFHWYTIQNLAKKFNYKIKHLLNLNWGCQNQSQITTFKKNPKIIHLGKLNSYWVNPKLLSVISEKNNLKIFSYETPDSNFYPKLSNFFGYLKDENQIAKYQFGLITLSQDKLRSESFSAKHLLYFSYGLPVLCPEWRKDKLLNDGTIYYNEKNINRQIKKYSEKKLWLKKHQSALRISQSLDWNISLKPLLTIINKIYESK